MIKTPEDCKGRGPNFAAHWFVYDFEVCIGTDEQKQALATINYHGYDLVAVTQTMDKYTVFFRRLAG